MSDSNTLSQRHRRKNPKRRREEIYCYDTGSAKEDSNENDEEVDKLDDIEEDDDDDDASFIYGTARIKKSQSKKKRKYTKTKNHNLKKKNIDEDKETRKKTQKQQEKEHNSFYAPYAPAVKPKVELKIFNPELYLENVELKAKYQKELEEIYEEYGKKLVKVDEPSVPAARWKYFLKQVEETSKDFISEKEERVKLNRKIAKFSQSTYNRFEQINEQKIREQEKKIRKHALQLARHVKRQFWGSTMKVRKILYDQISKKNERESKMKKLEDLVAKQFEASQKITKILENFKEVSLDNLQVSHTTRVPVIIDIKKKPKCTYLGLHEDNAIRPSLLIKFPLREYQLLGVYWLSTLQNKGMNAILADEMGLGKTIQTIALLAHLAIEKGIWGPHLVIVPTTILINWEIEFKRWCPAFKIMTYFGSPKQRKLKRKGWSKLNTFHICITSYKIAVTDHPIFRRKKWYYMILDEAQNIKNFKSQRWQILLNFKTKSRLLLTGTPLQNDLTELWSLLHFLMPKIFNSFDDFNEWFNIPFQEALEKNFPISQEILKKLHTVLRPFFLRRLKKDVETQLPKKSESIIRCSMSRRQKYLYDEMIWHENKKNKNRESTGMMNVLMGLKKICNHPDLFQPRIQESPLNWVPITIVIAHHMFLKVHMETYKTHILKDFVDHFTTQFEEIADDIFREYDQQNITPDNEVYYKHKLIDRLRFAKVNYERSKRKQFRVYPFQFPFFQIEEKKIPYYMTKTISERAKEFQTIFDKFVFVVPKVMARPATLATVPMNSQVQAQLNRLDYLKAKIKRIIPPELDSIRSRFLLYFPNKNIILYDSGKLIKMVFLLKAIKYRGQKALVFTQMTKMLDIFQKVLNMFKFNYVRLDGNTKTENRQTIVQRFNNDARVLCFISSTRSGGIGLNLTGASNVIFYDTDWNPAMDKQAQDRCHRIGQTRNVIIYRLITEHSIEQNILMKSIAKRRLQSMVTQQGKFDTSCFQKVSLKGLLQGAIDYNDDHQADLAQVEDAEDRQMLHLAERENNNAKEEEQEELDQEMLPKLFRYGLNMLENTEFIESMKDDDISDGEEIPEVDEEDEELVDDDEMVVEEIDEEEKESSHDKKGKSEHSKHEQANGNHVNGKDHHESRHEQNGEKRKRSESVKSVESINDAPMPVEDQFKEIETHKITTLQKLKAMAIYQNQYLFMKQHYYQQEAEAAIPAATEVQVVEVKKAVPKKIDRRKKRKRLM